MLQRDSIQVLTVDDDADFVDMLGDILEHQDDCLSVITATSAFDGLKMLDEHQIDCVISDFEMPGLNGLEFLREVRRRWDDLPFILFTGHGDRDIARKAVSAGVTDYLQKDFGMGQYSVLAKLVREAVS